MMLVAWDVTVCLCLRTQRFIVVFFVGCDCVLRVVFRVLCVRRVLVAGMDQLSRR